MAENESVDNVFRALHNAVLEAQKLTEEQHQRQLARYFEDDGTPRLEEMRVPDIRKGKEGEWRTIQIPKMALSPPGALRIKDLRIRFAVNLLGFLEAQKKHKGFQSVPSDPKEHSGPLFMEFASQPTAVKKGDTGPQKHTDEAQMLPQAEIEIRFESVEPPDAYHRITELLNKMIP